MAVRLLCQRTDLLFWAGYPRGREGVVLGARQAEGRAAAFWRPRDGARRRGPRQDRVECGQGAPFARNAAESWRHAMAVRPRGATSGHINLEQGHLVLTVPTHRRSNGLS